MMRNDKSLRNILELTHRLDLEEATWLDTLFQEYRAMSPSEHVCFMMGSVISAFREIVLKGCGNFSAGLGAFDLTGWSPESTPFILSRGSMFWWSDLAVQAEGAVSPGQVNVFKDALSPVLLDDARMYMSFDPSGHGVSIAEGVAQAVGRGELHDGQGWIEATSHFGAAWRLRRLLSNGQGALEAVIDPDGRKVQHADGLALDADARESLRFATRAIDRARSRLALDPMNELLAQQVMVQGRWTLIDQFDSDGKHMMLARVNDPIAPETLLPTLSARERQIALYVALGHSLKLISYELGLPKSTVSAALRRALKKLGLHGAAQLAEHVQRLIAQQFEPASSVRDQDLRRPG